MKDSAWRRRANPWSVWTSFAAIPAMIVAIWSRVWLGWVGALLPVAVVVLWLVVNPVIFLAVDVPKVWVSKGSYGSSSGSLSATVCPRATGPSCDG